MPSLTLTDPDMILPYDGGERESSTPSPPSQLVYLTNLNARYNAADHHAGSSASGSKKNFSRHAWNHEEKNGRRLSDIGEELSPARTDEFDDESGARPGDDHASSPVLPDQSPAPEAKENAVWSSSSSIVSTGSARASKEVSSPQVEHDASPAQADDTKKSEDQIEVNMGFPDPHAIATAAAKGKGPGEEFSSAILSSEAERILENAKKRLTVREDRTYLLSRRNADLSHSLWREISTVHVRRYGSHRRRRPLLQAISSRWAFTNRWADYTDPYLVQTAEILHFDGSRSSHRKMDRPTGIHECIARPTSHPRPVCCRPIPSDCPAP